MKLLRWSAVLVFTTTLAACSDAVAPAPQAGQFTGRWAGSEWVGDAAAWIHSFPGGTETLTISGYRVAPGMGEEEIIAQVPYTGPGKYLLAPGKAYLQMTVGGDGITGKYTNTVDYPGVLEITGFDDKGNVEGELSFEASTGGTFTPYGMKTKLESGRFRAKLTFAP